MSFNKTVDIRYILFYHLLVSYEHPKKVAIEYMEPLVIYKTIYPHYHLFMTLYSKILRGLFKNERLKPALVRTDHRNVSNLSQLKQILNIGIRVDA